MSNFETDAVTGLYTQRTFLEKAAELIASRNDENMLIVRFTIEDISLFENNFGLEKMQTLLSLITDSCCTYDSNDVVWGIFDSYQFVYCCTESFFSIQEAIRYEQYVQKKLNVPFRLSIKHGVYRITDRTVPVETMCNRALLALNSVLHNYNQNCAYFTESLLKESLLEQELINDMASAMENNEFSIAIQPQFNQWNSTLYGGEALVRWNHPRKGTLSPDVFIPIFEKTGLISKLDEYVLQLACRLQRKMLDNGVAIVPISVNLSPIDLIADNCCEKIIEIVQEHHLLPEHINLEVTETAFMYEKEKVIAVIGRLRELGFKVEMDDFGSGYSSLNTLKNIPVDILKLDLDFLSESNEKSGKILSAMVRMAHSLGIPVIAEGIETLEQADFLRSIGCFYAQGYFFARPMSTDDFELLLDTVKKDYTQEVRFTSRTQRGGYLISDSNAANILLDNATGAAGVIEYDGDDAVMLRMNDEFYQLLGVRKDVNMTFQHHFKQHFSKQDWKTFSDTIETVINSEGTGWCDTRMDPPPGSDLPQGWLRTKFRHVQTNDDRCVLYIRAEDVTQEKKNEEKLKIITSEYEAFLNATPGGVINVEYSNDRFSVVYVNENAAVLFGFTQAEYLERLKENPFALIAVDERELFISKVTQAVKDGTNHVDLHCHNLCKDGSVKAMRFVGNVQAIGDGRLTGSVLLLAEDDIDDSPAEVYRLSEKRVDTSLNTIQPHELEHIIQSSNTPFFRFASVDGGILFASDAFCKLMGYTKVEFSERFHAHFTEMIDAQDRQRIITETKFAISNKLNRFVCEFRIETASGSAKWIRTESYLITGPGNRQWYLSVAADIDDEKKKDAEFELLREFCDVADTGDNSMVAKYTITGNRWNLDYVSTAYLEMTGYSREEIMLYSKTDPLALVHRDDREEIRRIELENAQNPKRHHITYRILSGDGRYIWLDSDVNYIKKDGVSVQYMTHRNITEQKQLELQINDEKNQMHAIIEAMSGCVALYELKLDGACTVFVSKGCIDISGYEPEDFTEKYIQDQPTGMSRRDTAIVYEMLKLAAKTGESPKYTVSFINKDKERVWVSVCGKSIGEKNGNPLVLAVCHKIPDNEKLYEQILEDSETAMVIMEKETNEVFYSNQVAEDILHGNTESILSAVDEEPEMNQSHRCQAYISGSAYNVRITRQMWNGRDCLIFTLKK